MVRIPPPIQLHGFETSELQKKKKKPTLRRKKKKKKRANLFFFFALKLNLGFRDLLAHPPKKKFLGPPGRQRWKPFAFHQLETFFFNWEEITLKIQKKKKREFGGYKMTLKTFKKI